MLDLRPKIDQPNKPIAPGVGIDPATRTVPKGPVGTSPQPKGTNPIGNHSGNTDSKDPVRISRQPKP